MPRAFSDAERARIESRLFEAARAMFERHGLRKTNVAELARAAGIGKGTFYLFFPTKEELFIALVDRHEKAVKAELMTELDAELRAGADARRLLRRYFELQLELLTRHPLLAVLTDPEELELLLRRVPPERLAEAIEEDAVFFAELFADWQRRGLVDPTIDPRAASAVTRGLLAMVQRRELVGERDWPGMIELLIDALANRLAQQGEPT
ncbi:TetR/AcrR family transcriptional regulator [Nannocystaceae bacterium ST9]